MSSQLQKQLPFAKGVVRDIFEASLFGANRASLLDARTITVRP
jgi:hypothetical protein